MENYLEKYQNWLESSIFDESTKNFICRLPLV